MGLYIIKVACERPDAFGRSISQWDCRELAQQLVRDAVVGRISVETVRQILLSRKLRPWRHHMWLSTEVPRDDAFAEKVREISDLYTRVLGPDEVVLSVDEQTNLQPRPRSHETMPAQEGNRPNQVEQHYKRCGALNVLAALDTRTGHVYATLQEKKRQVEFIVLLEKLEEEIPSTVRKIHLLMDNYSTHSGKLVREWLRMHSRFVCHNTPVHCSWMNQVEQWFGILRRKRLGIIDFASKVMLKEKLFRFIDQWNETTHRFRWSEKSFHKVLAKCQKAPELSLIHI